MDMTASSVPAERVRSGRWLVVAAMAVPLLMLTIDAFGLTVALPAIGHALDTTTTTLAWVFNAFLFTFAAPQIAAGRLADTFGRRRVVLLGLIAFIAGSIAAGTAQSIGWLIAARALQGLGTALSFVASLAIVSNAFPPAQRGQAIGIWAAAGTIGQSLGPLVGGVLTEKLSWRWFFFVNVPLGIAAIFMTLYVVEESRDESAPRRFDLRGFVMLTVGLVLVVLGVQTSGQSGWGSPLVVVSVLAGLAAIALFLMLEPRVRTPLIEFALFRNRVFMGTLLIHFSWNWVWSVFMFLLTLYLQHVRDLSPLQTGVLYLGFALPFVIGSSVAGKVGARVGERMQILGGMSLGVLGSLIFALLAEQASYALIVLGFVALGVGGALSYNAATSLGMASVPDAKSGEASGIQNTVLQLGAVFGLAAGTAVFKAIENQRVLASLERAGARLSQGDRGELAGLLSGSDAAQQRLGTLAPAVAGQIERIVNGAFMDGLHAAMTLSIAVAVLGVASALLLRGNAAPAKR